MIRNAVFLRLFALVATLSIAGAAQAQFKLTSPDIKPGGTIADEQVFNGFGCSGKNISPALKWSGAPKETKGFALLVHDPDALRSLIKLFTTKRIALGSDYPLPLGEETPGVLIESISELSDADREQMLSGTAREFLGISRTHEKM